MLAQALAAAGSALDGAAAMDAEAAAEYAAYAAAGWVLCSLAAYAGGSGAREHIYSLQSLGALAGCCAACWRHHPDLAARLANPLGVSPAVWLAGYVFKFVSIHAIDAAMVWFAKRFNKGRLMYRVNTADGKDTDHPLIWIDRLFLFLNSFLETAFLFHLADFVWNTPGVKWAPGEVTLLNVVPALWVSLFVNDMLYAPMHLLLHHRWLYAYIHKHHHRSLLPSRYYTDAGNDHPLEQIGGLACLMAALHLALRTTGLHLLAIQLHFPVYVCMQILNHSPFDMRFNVLGIQYESGLHEMHHRIPSCNMAQYCMAFDKLVGTYRPYQEK